VSAAESTSLPLISPSRRKSLVDCRGGFPGAFMEVLDTSIANVALPHIAGDLGASNDESTWVLTSYLVSTRLFFRERMVRGILGRKRFFMICILIFTVTSLLCGVAWSWMAAVRARGAGSGRRGLQRWRKRSWRTRFRGKRGLAFSLYGVTAIVGRRSDRRWALDHG